MNVSLNWLRDFVDLPHPPSQIADMLTALGLEVEGQHVWQRIPGGLAGVVVGQVLTCEKHPGADRLSLTTVDIGAPEPIQIVCGAPNVAAGQFVPVATVGTTLHPLGGDPFTIKKGKIRGEASVGMICAEDELGLGISHDGILVFDKEYAPGTAVGEVFELAEDTVFEVGLTPNRSDATSHRGVAADLRAYLVTHEGYDKPLREGRGLSLMSVSDSLPACIPVKVFDAERAPRYAGIVLEGIKVAPSPQWLKDRLAAVGVRSINNAVDATNYVLHGIGQPLHAFDLDKVGGPGIHVQTLPPTAEGKPVKFVSLDDKTRELDADDLVICDADDAPMCIAGVFGGATSGVTETTTRMFLESACFEPRSTRRTATRHLLHTDAARSFEKGVDPAATVDALLRACSLLGSVAGARPATQLVDIVASPVVPARVVLTYKGLERLAGIALPNKRVRLILEALSLSVVSEDEAGLTLDVPTDKVDVTREADVVEEVLRVYGYDDVPLPAQIKLTPAVSAYPSGYQLRRRAAEYLIGRGLHEGMGLSLVPSRVYEELAPEYVERLVRIHNTSTVELDAMRVSLVPTGLQAITYNQNRQRADLQFFEFGKGYLRADSPEAAPQEYEQLAIWATGLRRGGHWAQGLVEVTGFSHVRGLAEGVLAGVGVEATGERGFEASASTGVPAAVFGYAQQLMVGDEVAATVGRISGAYTNYFDTKSDEVYLALIHWPAIAKAAVQATRQRLAPEVSRFPQVKRDLAVVVSESVTFGQIADLAKGPAGPFAKSTGLFDVFEDVERLGAGKRSYALRFVFERLDRTLKDKEVDRAMSGIVQAIDSHPHMEVRR